VTPRRTLCSTLVALLVALGTAPALAADERDAREDGERRAEPASEEREVPDYDGRGSEPTTAGDVALWVPRIVLFPPYVVSEYVLRRPLGWAIAGAERAGLPAAIYDVFTFGPNHDAGFFPTAYFDFGFRTSVGLYTFWNNAFTPGHDLVLRGSTGGKDWLTATFSERFRFGPNRSSSFTLEASGVSRPDYAYFGLGPDTRQGALLRYGQDRLQGRLALEQRPSSATLLCAEVTLRSVEFRPGGFADDARLSDAVAAGLTPPPGYTRGYTLVRSELTATYDERKLRPARRAGVFGGARGSLNSELREKQSFVTYGAKVGTFVDLNERGRVVSLAVSTRFADPLDGGEIPFTELVTLGGLEPMRSFYAGRLADRSAAVAELAYRWPIWIWLNGAMRAEVGNVFGEHLAGFDAKKLRWSGTIGVESTNPAETGFELLFGVGSETFESGGKVDSIRFVIGTTNGL
jgi:hypothetical protein